jgi:hypothetical protein|eukprot:COSAG06_NODE_3083_length_5882_cov_2.584990_3_plen_106_part_00
MGDEYDYDDEPYQQTACEKFQDRFLYCFIPTLCLMFDASFITIGVICLASGSDDDFDKCSGDRALPPARLCRAHRSPQPAHARPRVSACAQPPTRSCSKASRRTR